MIYYPLQLLQLGGIRDVLLVTGKGHAGQMIDLLGDGRLAPRGGGDPILEVDLTYKVQTEPGGIAQVVGMARDFAAGAPIVVVLGDNIFEFAQSAALSDWAEAPNRARIFVKEVDDPENFGVVVYDEQGGVADIVEKAGVVDTRFDEPPSSHAVVGLYCYPPDVFDVIERLAPSTRGELEITDVNRRYLELGALHVVRLGRGIAWLDTGTCEALLHAANFVQSIEERQGLIIACLEEIAYRQGYIDAGQLRALAEPMRKAGYGQYLLRLLDHDP